MPQPTTNPRIEELKARVGGDPKSRHFYPLAEELRKVGRVEEAEQILRDGLTTHSSYVSAWVSLGRVLKDQSKWAEAVDVLRRASSLDPGNVVTERLLGESYLALGDKLEALKKLKLVYALMPSDQALEAQIVELDREVNGAVPVSPPQIVEEPVSPALEETELVEAAGGVPDESPFSVDAIETASPDFGEALGSEAPAVAQDEPPAEQTHELWRPAAFEPAPDAPRLTTTEEPFSEVSEAPSVEAESGFADDVFGDTEPPAENDVFAEAPAFVDATPVEAGLSFEAEASADPFEDSSPEEGPQEAPSSRQRKVENLNRWLSAVRGAGNRV
jgi:hypothetical protein